GKYLVISDGAKLFIGAPKSKPTVEAVPGKLDEHLLHQFTRSTTWPMRVHLAISTEADKRLVLAVSDFKLKGKEKFGKIETKVITYSMKIERDDEVRASVTLWIDAQTQLPVKRVQRWFKDEPPSIDLFGEWKLGKKLDAKLFAVPK